MGFLANPANRTVETSSKTHGLLRAPFTCFYLYLFGPTIFWGWVEKNHQLALGRVALRKPTYKAFCTKGDLYGLIMSRIIKAEGFSKWR